MAKIYPAPDENTFFVVPGKGTMPLWKQEEIARDPSFRDLREQIKDMEVQGSKGIWSDKHGYATTFKQEAAILKAKAKPRELKNIEAMQKTRLPDESVDSCCTIC